MLVQRDNQVAIHLVLPCLQLSSINITHIDVNTTRQKVHHLKPEPPDPSPI
jgi:hypothetical protein